MATDEDEDLNTILLGSHNMYYKYYGIVKGQLNLMGGLFRFQCFADAKTFLDKVYADRDILLYEKYPSGDFHAAVGNALLASSFELTHTLMNDPSKLSLLNFIHSSYKVYFYRDIKSTAVTYKTSIPLGMLSLGELSGTISALNKNLSLNVQNKTALRTLNIVYQLFMKFPNHGAAIVYLWKYCQSTRKSLNWAQKKLMLLILLDILNTLRKFRRHCAKNQFKNTKLMYFFAAASFVIGACACYVELQIAEKEDEEDDITYQSLTKNKYKNVRHARFSHNQTLENKSSLTIFSDSEYVGDDSFVAIAQAGRRSTQLIKNSVESMTLND